MNDWLKERNKWLRHTPQALAEKKYGSEIAKLLAPKKSANRI